MFSRPTALLTNGRSENVINRRATVLRTSHPRGLGGPCAPRRPAGTPFHVELPRDRKYAYRHVARTVFRISSPYTFAIPKRGRTIERPSATCVISTIVNFPTDPDGIDLRMPVPAVRPFVGMVHLWAIA